MRELKKRWKLFFAFLLDPFTLFLIIITAILGYFTSTQTNGQLTAILTTLTSISSAVLGSRIMTLWLNATEGRTLVARGKTAIRNLILLLKNISLMENRVKIYLERLNNKKLSKEVLQTYFEEIVEKYQIIEEESVNSIEDWKDIIPEADVKTKIGIISDLNIALKEKQKERDQLKVKLEEIKDKSAIEREELNHKLKDKDAQITQLKDELTQQAITFDKSVLSGMTKPSGTWETGSLNLGQESLFNISPSFDEKGSQIFTSKASEHLNDNKQNEQGKVNEENKKETKK